MSTPPPVLELLAAYRAYVELLTTHHVVVDPDDLRAAADRIDRLEWQLKQLERARPAPTPETCSSSEDGHDLVAAYQVRPAEVARG